MKTMVKKSHIVVVNMRTESRFMRASIILYYVRESETSYADALYLNLSYRENGQISHTRKKQSRLLSSNGV